LIYGVYQQMGVGNVAALAPLGGAAVGVLDWFLWRSRRHKGVND
jgi:hypothetical protein